MPLSRSMGTNGYFSNGALSLQLYENKWYAWQDSNLRPFAPEANALSI